MPRSPPRLSETNHLARESDTRRILELGNDAWPFPVPIVQTDGRWFFDTPAGKDEIMNRRIGRNELSTLKVVRAYVEAQREYASKDRDGSGVLKFAQKIISTPGKKDGLFWSPDFDGEIESARSARRRRRGRRLRQRQAGPRR